MTTERNDIVDKAVDLALRQPKEDAGRFDEELASFVGKSSVHLDAFLRSDAALRAYTSAHDAWASSVEQRAKSRSPNRKRAFVVAAVVASLLAAGVAVKSRQIGEESLEFRPLARRTNASGADFLSERSRVFLSEDGLADVRFSRSQRRLDLDQGAVLVNVTPDATRPFVLRVGNVYARALGTEFSASGDGSSVHLSVTEGSVSVGRSCSSTSVDSGNPLMRLAEEIWQRVTPLPKMTGEPVIVKKGQAATISSSCSAGHIAVEDLKPADMAKRLAWTHQWLNFSGRTIGQAVAQLNLENRRQMVVLDPVLALQPFGGGTFEATDLESFMAALKVTFAVKASGTDPIYLQGADCGWDGQRCAARAR